MEVTCSDGYRVGYSSDFYWPLESAISVDELVVDATYGDHTRIRQYDQSTVDEKLISLVATSIRTRQSTALIGYNGRLQYALHICSGLMDLPVICSPKAYPLLAVYNQHGYQMPPVKLSTSPDAIAMLRAREPVVAIVTLPERRHLPWLDRFRKITLSGFMAKIDDPVMLYDNGDCRIALTDHADFDGTLEYVAATGAKTVWTDPRSGNAEALAQALSARLGVSSAVAPRVNTHGWG